MNKQTISRKYAVAAASAGLIAVLGLAALAVPAMAQTTNTTAGINHSFPQGGRTGMNAPGVFGTVSAINGTTLTVTSKGFMGGAGGMGSAGAWMGHRPNATSTAVAPTSTQTPPTQTTTTYTVDASNATVTKAGAASSVSAIAVGDMVMVRGTVSGANVTATAIMDGIVRPQGMTGRGGTAGTPGQGTKGTPGSAQVSFQGNGEPVVGGSVSAISGTTLTVTNKSNVVYSVDASAATVMKGGATSTIASVASGDTVLVQGTVNGTSVTASTVIDQGTTPSATTGTKPPAPRGILGAIGNFFSHLFGF